MNTSMMHQLMGMLERGAEDDARRIIRNLRRDYPTDPRVMALHAVALEEDRWELLSLLSQHEEAVLGQWAAVAFRKKEVSLSSLMEVVEYAETIEDESMVASPTTHFSYRKPLIVLAVAMGLVVGWLGFTLLSVAIYVMGLSRLAGVLLTVGWVSRAGVVVAAFLGLLGLFGRVLQRITVNEKILKW